MALPALPAVSSLPTSSADGLAHVLDALFEPSPAIHALLLPVIRSTTFDSYNAMIDSCRAELARLSTDPAEDARRRLHAILGSHPRLGAKKVDSAQSTAEQAQLRSGGDDGTELAALNADYEVRFPGLRYVVFVNGRGRPEIMANMRARIARGDLRLEEAEAIQVGQAADVAEHWQPGSTLTESYGSAGHVRHCEGPRSQVATTRLVVIRRPQTSPCRFKGRRRQPVTHQGHEDLQWQGGMHTSRTEKWTCRVVFIQIQSARIQAIDDSPWTCRKTISCTARTSSHAMP